jgi:hypothetical protein
MRAAWIGLGLVGCGDGPDVLGDWVAHRVDEYVLANGGGVLDLTETPYPLEEPLDPPAADGAVAVETNLRLSFAPETVDEVVETARMFDDADPVVVDRAGSTWHWENSGQVEVKLEGSFDADRYTCNVVAGPGTLVCNLEREVAEGLHVVSTRYGRAR